MEQHKTIILQDPRQAYQVLIDALPPGAFTAGENLTHEARASAEQNKKFRQRVCNTAARTVDLRAEHYNAIARHISRNNLGTPHIIITPPQQGL